MLSVPRSTRPIAALAAAAALAFIATACAPASGGSSGAGSGGSPAAGGALLGWSDVLTGEPDKLDVATTVAPISSIARNIGGDRIRLRGLIPDGTNSHTFEPAPSDAQTLAKADLIVVNGLHLEQPTLELADASKRPETPIRQLADDTITKEQWLFDFSFPASAGDPNPHLWMDPVYARRYAELLRDWFSQADPANAATYAANFSAYAARLDQLDAMIRKAVATVPAPDRKLLTYHDSWAYWAREYGFTVIGAVQASDFSDPSPQERRLAGAARPDDADERALPDAQVDVAEDGPAVVAARDAGELNKGTIARRGGRRGGPAGARTRQTGRRGHRVNVSDGSSGSKIEGSPPSEPTITCMSLFIIPRYVCSAELAGPGGSSSRSLST